MKFAQVAQSFSVIESLSSRLEITAELAKLFTACSCKEAEILAYLCLGSLRAPYKGTQFNIAQKTVVSMMSDILGVDHADFVAHVNACGDISASIAQYAASGMGDYTLEEMYERLIVIEAIVGEGAQGRRCQQLLALLQEIPSLQAQYIVRIVLGTLRLNFLDMTLLDSLSYMLVGTKKARVVLENAYNVCADIGKIAFIAKSEGLEGLKEVSIVVGIPIRPAAAERMSSAQDIIDKIGYSCAQPKIDGFRLQIHIDRRGKQPQYAFFSRNLIDMSSLFPDIVAELGSIDVETLIVEGEAVAYNQETGEFLPFQETVKRKRKHDIAAAAEALPIQLFLFDCLYKNGVSLLDKTHEQRRAELLSLVIDTKMVAGAVTKTKANTKMVIDAFGAAKAKEKTRAITSHVFVIAEECFGEALSLEKYFWENIQNGLEGLVVKKPDSVYTPGKRNFGWIKLKRQESGSLDDTIDIVILGYYYGQGKRAAFGIGSFLGGIYNKHTDMFETIAKVGTGMTDDELRTLKTMLDDVAVKTKPHNVICAKELYPDVWCVPTYVCSVRADNITRSPLHAAGKSTDALGYALRFPRFMGHRPDKLAVDATDTDEIVEFYKRITLVQK